MKGRITLHLLYFEIERTGQEAFAQSYARTLPVTVRRTEFVAQFELDGYRVFVDVFCVDKVTLSVAVDDVNVSEPVCVGSIGSRYAYIDFAVFNRIAEEVNILQLTGIFLFDPVFAGNGIFNHGHA